MIQAKTRAFTLEAETWAVWRLSQRSNLAYSDITVAPLQMDSVSSRKTVFPPHVLLVPVKQLQIRILPGCLRFNLRKIAEKTSLTGYLVIELCDTADPGILAPYLQGNKQDEIRNTTLTVMPL